MSNRYQEKTMKHAGTWCIVFGAVSIATGVAVGVGCLVAAGKLIAGANRL